VVDVPSPRLQQLTEAQEEVDKKLDKPSPFVLLLSWGEWR
jgi:hypothetical protein